MRVQGKRSVILESQLPKGMEGTIDRIAELEGLGVQYGQTTPEEDTGKPPEFITSPSDLTINENGFVSHFKTRTLTYTNISKPHIDYLFSRIQFGSLRVSSDANQRSKLTG